MSDDAHDPTNSESAATCAVEQQDINQLEKTSRADWEREKHWLVHNYEHLNWSTEGLSNAMRQKKYKVSPTAVGNHLRDWGIRRYLSRHEKQDLFQKCLESLRNNSPLPVMTAKQLYLLRRHLTENGDISDDTRAVIATLSNMKRTGLRGPQASVAEASDLHAQSIESAVSTDGFDSEIPSQSVETFTILSGPDSVSRTTSDTEPSQSESGANNDQALTTNSNVPATFLSLPASDISMIVQPAHFNDKFEAIQTLSRLVTDHYLPRMREYLLYTANDWPGVSNTDVISSPIHAASIANKAFWGGVQSAVYYMKVDSDDLAQIELKETFGKVESICSIPAYTLLRNLLSNLSPIATSVSSVLRPFLLDTFINRCTKVYGPDHSLTRILRILYNEDANDRLSMTALQILSDELGYVLPESHQENFDAKYDLVRLLRWGDDLADADRRAVALVESCERNFGPYDIKTRLALSERVYIMNKRGKHRAALHIAIDVKTRARRGLGTNYPDNHAIYGMEDEAEIYEQLGKIDESIGLLKSARNAALLKWPGNHTSTTHIIEKLDRLFDQKGRKT